MKCQSCNNEMYVDHTELSEDGKVDKYVYACVNPQCRDYRRAMTLTGEETKTKIQPKPSQV